MRRVSLEELLKQCLAPDYSGQHAYVMGLLAEGRIKPVKTAKGNGKTPALCLSYWEVGEARGRGELEEELKFHLDPLISVEYYRGHLAQYEKDREWVLLLDQYLKTRRDCLKQPESANERSFEIWGREKFLTEGPGKRILRRCGIDPAALNLYATAEPLAYYCHTRETPQNMLILENRDTFFSMRKYLLDGGGAILGLKVGTLIYGGGKRIDRSFREFWTGAEPYMGAEGNSIYYFGDLDHEGIGIFEGLRGQSPGGARAVPFLAAYGKMLEKAEAAGRLPDMKEGQGRRSGDLFFSYFPEETAARMRKILAAGKYVPQEILNISDLGSGG